MRVYMYRPGRPGFILAEAVVEESIWTQHLAGHVGRRFVADHLCPLDVDELLTRDEMLEVSTRRRALLAWEADDDAPFNEGMDRRWADLAADNVREEAAMGCPDAQAIIARGLDPEEADQFQREHVCDSEPRFRQLLGQCGLAPEEVEKQVEQWRAKRRHLTLITGV
jgi:hypothetical protein